MHGGTEGRCDDLLGRHDAVACDGSSLQISRRRVMNMNEYLFGFLRGSDSGAFVTSALHVVTSHTTTLSCMSTESTTAS